MSGKSRTPVPDGWAAHRDAQLRDRLRLTPAERLAWLEQAKEFAAQARASRKKVRSDASRSTRGRRS